MELTNPTSRWIAVHNGLAQLLQAKMRYRTSARIAGIQRVIREGTAPYEERRQEIAKKVQELQQQGGANGAKASADAQIEDLAGQLFEMQQSPLTLNIGDLLPEPWLDELEGISGQAFADVEPVVQGAPVKEPSLKEPVEAT